MNKNIYVVLSLLLLTGLQATAQTNTPDYLPTDGLVGWWPFNGNANDNSGNGNNGVVTNVVLSTDRFGNPNAAYLFNGTNSRIDVAEAPSLNVRKGITLSAWVKCTDTSRINQVIYKGSMNADGEGYSLTILDSGRYTSGVKIGSNCVPAVGWNGGGVSKPQSFTQNTWMQLTSTYDGTTYSLYKNGILDSSFAAAGLIDSCAGGGLRFGFDHLRYFVSTGDPFSGTIDDIGIWNRALSSSEIAQLFSGTADCGNGKMGVNVCDPKRSLHIKDVLRLEPRSTEPSNPGKGDIYFDDTINKLRVYDGTAWQNCW